MDLIKFTVRQRVGRKWQAVGTVESRDDEISRREELRRFLWCNGVDYDANPAKWRTTRA